MDNFFKQSEKINEVLENQKISNLKQNFDDISLEYRKQNINSKTVVSSENKVLAYLSGRMGETSVVVDSVLSKLDKVTNFSSDVKSVLDLGSGTGSVLWAIENYIPKANVVAVEKEKLMIKYSKVLSSDLNLNIDYIQENVLSKNVEELNNADLVIESYMLNELTENEAIKILDLMAEKTRKYLVIVEPGTPKSYEKMMIFRDYLLSKGLNLILPCPHSDKCGLNNDYCNFSVRVPRSKLVRQVKSGALNYEDEKYFYLIFSKEKQAKNYNSTILRRPIYRKGCVDLKLCGSDSQIKIKTITKSDKQKYKVAKDYKHGDNINLV